MFRSDSWLENPSESKKEVAERPGAGQSASGDAWCVEVGAHRSAGGGDRRTGPQGKLSATEQLS